MYRIAALFLLLMQVMTAAYAQVPPAQRVQLISHTPQSYECADVAGYTSPGGVKYALIGHEQGAAIYSLADPANPVLLQALPGAQSIWREIDLYQHYAYICTEGGGGFQIVDLSTLPGTVAYKDTIIDSIFAAHTLHIDGDRLYLHGASTLSPGPSTTTEVFSIANPWEPVRLGTYIANNIHDGYVRSDTGYIAVMGDGMLRMVDFTDPQNPVDLGSAMTPGAFTHNAWLNAAGNACFTTDEVDSIPVTSWDITDPANITELDHTYSSLSQGAATAHNVKVYDEYLVTAWYRDGLNIVDATRPHNLVEMGWYDTSPLSGAGFNGAWSADPMGDSLVLVGDMEGGLFVLKVQYERACWLEGEVLDSLTGLPISGARIRLAGREEFSGFAGNYATGVADSGTYTVQYDAQGYFPRSIPVTLDNGVLVLKDVRLLPFPVAQPQFRVLDAQTQQAVPGALLHMTGSVGTQQYSFDAGGQLSIPGVLADTYQVTLGAWGWNTQQFTYIIPAGASQDTFYLPPGYYDDFFFDFGWTVQTAAQAGAWEMGEPEGVPDASGNPFQTDADLLTDFGDQCWVTGLSGGGMQTNDLDAGITTLRSPVMDLTAYQRPILHISRWFALGTGNTLSDTLTLRISNGAQMVNLKQIGSTAPAWVQDSFDLQTLLPITGSMQFEVSCKDQMYANAVEAAVDGFRVAEGIPLHTELPVAEAGMVLYPHPVQGQASVQFLYPVTAGNRLQITDMAGRLCWEATLTAGTTRLALPAFPAGAYLLHLLEGNTIRVSQKMICF